MVAPVFVVCSRTSPTELDDVHAQLHGWLRIFSDWSVSRVFCDLPYSLYSQTSRAFPGLTNFSEPLGVKGSNLHKDLHQIHDIYSQTSSLNVICTSYIRESQLINKWSNVFVCNCNWPDGSTYYVKNNRNKSSFSFNAGVHVNQQLYGEDLHLQMDVYFVKHCSMTSTSHVDMLTVCSDSLILCPSLYC